MCRYFFLREKFLTRVVRAETLMNAKNSTSGVHDKWYRIAVFLQEIPDSDIQL